MKKKLSIYDFPSLYALRMGWKKHTIKGGHTIGLDVFNQFFVSLPTYCVSFDLITLN